MRFSIHFKSLFLITLLIMIIGLAGCDEDEDRTENAPRDTAVPTQAATEEPAPIVTQEATEAVQAVPTEEATQEASVAEPTEAVTEVASVPTQEPTEEVISVPTEELTQEATDEVQAVPTEEATQEIQAVATQEATEAPSTPLVVDPDDIKIQLSWAYNIEFAGFYAASENGYYEDEDLGVTLLPGGFDESGQYIDPVSAVLSGEAQFGVIGGDILLLSRAAGQPLVAIGTIYQRSPVVFASLAENDITRPADLVGHTVAVNEGNVTFTVYNALLASQSINRDEITEVPRTDFTGAPLANGEVDVLPAFITNEIVALQMEGHEVNYILASDYGIELYSNVIFTTEEMIAEHPDIVEGFLRATLQGMNYVVENPDNGAAFSVQYQPDLNLEAEQLGMDLSLSLIRPAGSEPGMMTEQAWNYTHDLLLEQGLLQEPLDIEDAYTLEFLNAIYGEN